MEGFCIATLFTLLYEYICQISICTDTWSDCPLYTVKPIMPSDHHWHCFFSQPITEVINWGRKSLTQIQASIFCACFSVACGREKVISDYEFNSIYPQGMPRFYQVVIVELVPFLLPDCLHLQLPRDDKHSLCHPLPSCTPAMHEGCTSLQLNLPLKDSILLQWWASPQNYIGYLNICPTLHQLGHLSISRYTDVFFTFIAQFCLENIHPSTNFWKLNIRKKSFDFTVQKFQNENALCKVPGVRVLGVLCNGASVPPGPTTARDWSQAPFS